MKPAAQHLPASAASQRGATLLEVLISIVVLAVGLLGYAGLQTVSLKNNLSAYHRSQATMLAYDVIDRIRADEPNAETYVLAFGDTPAGDLGQWLNLVKDALPGADAQIAFPDPLGTEPFTVQVTIRWEDERDGGTLDFVTESAL
ncbi:MAG: type IV pilus modification protein PilV [Hydrogenophilales bacterium 12-64-13]|nr:MAG: type IV pilus modification protein PilV [Hydrogenophilales bacterium 12-64-13]